MSKELEIAKKIALKAGKLVMCYYESGNFTVKDKGGFEDNYVTEADHASEKLIFEELQKNFPNHGFRGEETSNKPVNKEFVWIVDPIDGTREFVNRTGEFAVQIGLIRNNKLLLGVVFAPVFNNLFWAEKGKGAFLNGKQIFVSKKNKLKKMTMGISARFDKERNALCDKIDCGSKEIYGSAGFKIFLIAQGKHELTIFKKRSVHEWDLCAPNIILDEAGGKITTFDNKEIGYNRPESDYPLGVLISNNTIHEKLLKMLSS